MANTKYIKGDLNVSGSIFKNNSGVVNYDELLYAFNHAFWLVHFSRDNGVDATYAGPSAIITSEGAYYIVSQINAVLTQLSLDNIQEPTEVQAALDLIIGSGAWSVSGEQFAMELFQGLFLNGSLRVWYFGDATVSTILDRNASGLVIDGQTVSWSTLASEFSANYTANGNQDCGFTVSAYTVYDQ